jgi:hypothetical protein
MPTKIVARMLVFSIALLPLFLFGNYSRIFSDGLSRMFPSIDFHYNMPLCKSFSCPSTSARADKDKSIDFIVEEYKTATEEIKLRIEQEHLLFALKFILTGAVFGIVFRYYPGRLHLAQEDGGDGISTEEAYPALRSICLCSWAAVCVCSIVDVRLQFNTRIISDIGSWIRDCLEPCLVQLPIPGWETYFSHVGLPGGSPFSSILNGDRPLLTGLLYLFSVYAFVYIPKLSQGFDPRVSRDLLAIGALALPVCVILFGWSRLYFYFDVAWINYIYIFLVVVIAVVMRLCVSWLARLDPAVQS